MATSYRTTLHDLRPGDLRGGFFVGWPDPPDPEAHLRLLHGSYRVVLALDDDVVGFVTAVSDGVCAAYLPVGAHTPRRARNSRFIGSDQPRANAHPST